VPPCHNKERMMLVGQLKDILSMYPDDVQVHIMTNKNDYTQMMQLKHIRLLEIENERPAVLFTAYLGDLK